MEMRGWGVFGGIVAAAAVGKRVSVETRMVGSELNIFSNHHWRIYQISVGGLLYVHIWGFIRVSTVQYIFIWEI